MSFLTYNIRNELDMGMTESTPKTFEAYQNLNRKLDEIAVEKRHLNKKRECLEDETAQVNSIMASTQVLLEESRLESDDSDWQREILMHGSNLQYSYSESLQHVDKQLDLIDEKTRELIKSEDDAHREYEKVKREAESKRR